VYLHLEKARRQLEKHSKELVEGWTEGRVHGYIVNTLRYGSRKWPPKFQTLNEAKTEKKISVKSGRLAQHFRCASCSEEFTSKDIEVDHIKPVVDPKVGFVDWNTYIERMFCPKSNYQVLCTTCHKAKTKQEKQKGNK
jgi:5-methylcytosine-specific restriction endonuclease McrA